MLCNKCGKREATHFLKKNVNGKKTELALCAECARESKEFKYEPFSPLGYFDGLFGFPAIGGSAADSERNLNRYDGEKRCTLCASTFDDILNNGRVGCAECYNVFRDLLMPTIMRIHADKRYLGRRPSASKSSEEGDAQHEESVSERIARLRSELAAAVKNEDYERAAQLRDRIRDEEKNAG